MKNYSWILILLLSVAVIGGSLLIVKTLRKGDLDDNIKVVNNNLSKLGYSDEDIEILKEKLDEGQLESINKYYKNLANFVKIDYFNFEHLDRYIAYENRNTDISVQNIIINVESNIDKPFYTDIKTIQDPDDILVLVNKYNALSDSYETKNLEVIPSKYTLSEQKIRKDIMDKMTLMFEDALKENIKMYVVSGHRTKDYQANLYNKYVKNEGFDQAETNSARPRHSEHETGLAIDITDSSGQLNSFENTEQFKWLSENAYKYGFILRYKEDKQYLTGYIYEPWHYRYVGISAATKIYNEKLTLEEYIIKYE